MAILVITQEPQPSDADWPKRSATLTRNLERSKRPAALWLRSYVEMRTNPQKALDDWIGLVEVERKTLEEHPQQTDSQVLMKLLRIEVVQLERLGRNDEAKKAMHEMVAVERGDSTTLAELVSWLAKRHAWEVIDEVATRFASSFDAQPQLLYTLAQALSAEGKTQEADDTANRALKINPTQAREHWNIAWILQCRGLVDWSGPRISDTSIRSRTSRGIWPCRPGHIWPKACTIAVGTRKRAKCCREGSTSWTTIPI